MKQSKNNKIDFNNQRFYIGIDVHKKQWNVSIRNNQLYLKSFSMNPVPEELKKYLIKNYPGGEYNSVYEAGYCGYWIHEELTKLGIRNRITNPADVPTRGKEKLTKTDKVDSRKLARGLENGQLEGIYVPTKYHQELRSLCRLRHSLVKDQTRLKNRIKGHLSFYGKQIQTESKHWSNKYIEEIKAIEFDYDMGKKCLDCYIEELTVGRKRIVKITKQIREILPKDLMQKLTSVPGIGMITAATLYCEIMEMKRFKRIEELASYVGLVPTTYSTGQTERTYGITIRQNKYLRSILIESAWIAVRKDAAILMKFNELTKRMAKNRAIISIAKKLLRRIRHVWMEQEEYVCGVVA